MNPLHLLWLAPVTGLALFGGFVIGVMLSDFRKGGYLG